LTRNPGTNIVGVVLEVSVVEAVDALEEGRVQVCVIDRLALEEQKHPGCECVGRVVVWAPEYARSMSRT
jgi:hypothetical protein